MTHRSPASRTMKVGGLARVEGEGALEIIVTDGEVSSVQLQIYEPPRFFEGFLRGRAYTEPPDITARICGICPVAYQMSACLAIEDACGIDVDGQLRELRRLLYFGEWIESHTLHIYLLHAPDFLGYPSAIEMANDHRELVEQGLELKKIGNEVLETVGGRAIHPINVRVGGFYKVPARRDLLALRGKLERALDLATATVELVASFDFPDFDHTHPYVALHRDGEYAVMGGRITSTGDLDVPVSGFEEHFEETQVSWSTALHAQMLTGDHYLVGPLARYAINGAQLEGRAGSLIQQLGLPPEVRNPFQSIVVRAIEVVHACEGAIGIIDAYEPPDQPSVDVPPVAAVGHGATEAPRGLLYHRYEITEEGVVSDARIVPPTSQNQSTIEHDLFDFVGPRLDAGDDEIVFDCEHLIRSYDPCISCATHFLDARITREGSR